jgi:hypothetical protein
MLLQLQWQRAERKNATASIPPEQGCIRAQNCPVTYRYRLEEVKCRPSIGFCQGNTVQKDADAAGSPIIGTIAGSPGTEAADDDS